MFMLVLIGLSLVLIGVVGLQFTYLFYIERIYRERRKYLKTLEQKCSQLSLKLDAAEKQVREQKLLLDSVCPEWETSDEAWADLIEDR
jgi:hypothetical protein